MRLAVLALLVLAVASEKCSSHDVCGDGKFCAGGDDGKKVGQCRACAECEENHDAVDGKCPCGKGKGKKGGGGGGGGAGKPARKKNEVSEGRAYEQETRKTILSFGKLKKTVSGGKQVLKDVSLSMYLGAKIGVLGCKSTADHP